MSRFLKNNVIRKISIKSVRKTGWWAIRKKPIPSVSQQEAYQSKKIQSRVTQKIVSKALDEFGITDKEKRKRIHLAMQIRNQDNASREEQRKAEKTLNDIFPSLNAQINFIELTYKLHNDALDGIIEHTRGRL